MILHKGSRLGDLGDGVIDDLLRAGGASSPVAQMLAKVQAAARLPPTPPAAATAPARPTQARGLSAGLAQHVVRGVEQAASGSPPWLWISLGTAAAAGAAFIGWKVLKK